MIKKVSQILDGIIITSFYLLFFLVPLVLTPINYELFEYNKMMLTYALTILIAGSWMIKIVIAKKLNWRRTPLDIPLLLFLLSQIISTFLSIDPHVSLWGYYSRFNGGLLSTISYALLYFAFVNNFPKEKIRSLLKVIITSGVLVAVYGILEHFGIDRDLWVQDVQNRVFSTLGQPNWLAAYLAVLIPITIGFLLNSKFQKPSSKQILNSKNQAPNNQFNILNFKNWNLFGIWDLGFGILSIIFYAALIFTKSRSGFIGFWMANGILWLSVFIKYKETIIKWLLIFNFSFLIFNFISGTPFPQLNRFTLSELFNKQQITDNKQQIKPIGSSIIDVGITESGKIREIVWKGAIDIIKHYPVFGSGVETFAFSYYQFRPLEHNMTSEWDFLYNKAHNEYLNYAATTGIFGLGSYLIVIIVFIFWFLSKIFNFQFLISNQIPNPKIPNSKPMRNSELENSNLFGIWNLEFGILLIGLFTGWLSILVTNFFGFSVVIIQLFFFLIPAIALVLMNESDLQISRHSGDSVRNAEASRIDSGQTRMTSFQYIIIFILLSVICYLLFVVCKFWYADTIFATGYHQSKNQEYSEAYKNLKQAIILNENEPLYYDEFSYPAAALAITLSENKEATWSARLREEAVLASNMAVTTSPGNVNFWKSRTRVFYLLSQIDEKYFAQALESLEIARKLSPTDPKVRYNLALIYERQGKLKEAIDELVYTTKLKPDYRDAYFALGYLYDKNKQKDKAREALEFIITRIATNDAEAKKKLEELK